MLTPEYMQLIGEGAEEIASQLHTDIINAIVERITIRLGRGDDYVLTAKDKWQIEVLQDAGLLREDIEKEIAKRTKQQLKEIRKAFEDAGVTSVDYDNEVYRAAGLSPAPLQQSPHLIRLMQRAYEATQGEWRNYTRTTADEAQRLFIEQCDRAYNLVSTGAVSYTEAVKNAVETIAADGVTITYPSGHTDTIETATLRAVRTGVSQATAAITDARMDEMEWDIILVSSHLGARVTDAEDFTNHSWWQGKFYSKSGKDPRFPPFSVCGMGNVQGIHGANCRHHHMPGDGEFNPFEDYDSEDNRKQYELDQRQRALERRIRKTKREIMAAKTATKNGDEATKAKMQKLYKRKAALLKKQNKAYNKFCEDNDLKRLQDRLHVAGWNKSQASAAGAAARKRNGPKTAVKTLEKAEKSSTIKLNKRAGETLNSAADPMAEVFGAGVASNPKEIEKFKDRLKKYNVKLVEHETESLGYCPGLRKGTPGTAYISKGASYSAWAHEMQHVEDDMAEGWLGMSVIADPDKRYAMEVRAYDVEIELALQAGRTDIADRLRANLEEERRKIYGE